MPALFQVDRSRPASIRNSTRCRWPAAFRLQWGMKSGSRRGSLSAGYGFRKETIAGVRHNGRDAPTADFRPFFFLAAVFGRKWDQPAT
jgi:hypothetical protein